MAAGLIRCEHCGRTNRVPATAKGTLVILRKGEVAARQAGALPLPALRTWVERALA
jgi:thioredoxin 2